MHRPTASPITALLAAASLTLAVSACGGTPTATTQGTPAPTSDASEAATMAATESPAPTDSATPSAEPTEAAADGAEVTVGMSSFSPTELTIAAGTEVTFVNNSGLPHTITHGTGGRAADDAAFDRPIDDGATVTLTFDEPGTFDVTCKLHPTMQMTITVEG